MRGPKIRYKQNVLRGRLRPSLGILTTDAISGMMVYTGQAMQQLGTWRPIKDIEINPQTNAPEP